MEQKIKSILGEYAFTIAALQSQLDQQTSKLWDAEEKLKEYENKSKRKKTD